ncbi:MAG: hypothetical protein IKY51_00555 [Alistipes sp.]|nr:hypothetical protein [Alistipes sp.]
MEIAKSFLRGYAECWGLTEHQVELLEGTLKTAFNEGKLEGMHEIINIKTSCYDTITLQHHIGAAEN